MFQFVVKQSSATYCFNRSHCHDNVTSQCVQAFWHASSMFYYVWSTLHLRILVCESFWSRKWSSVSEIRSLCCTFRRMITCRACMRTPRGTKRRRDRSCGVFADIFLTPVPSRRINRGSVPTSLRETTRFTRRDIQKSHMHEHEGMSLETRTCRLPRQS